MLTSMWQKFQSPEALKLKGGGGGGWGGGSVRLKIDQSREVPQGECLLSVSFGSSVTLLYMLYTATFQM